MKWLDSLLRSKNLPTKLSQDDDIAQNINKKSHRDIGKRAKIIKLSRDMFHEIRGEYGAFSWKKLIDKVMSSFSQIVTTMTMGRWMLIVFLVFLSYIVYGLGFLIRTEDNIQSLLDNPGQIVATEGQHRVKELFQDYQIIGLVANNALFPLEPLATYGNILEHVRTLTSILHDILGMQGELYSWREESHEQSIFPILDTLFSYLGEISHEGNAIANLLSKLIGVEKNQEMNRMLTSFDSFLQDKNIWYSLLGKNGPTRILLLNQNSDELRAGGGFPGTAFIIEFTDGKLTRFEFYDIYALDWLLKGYRPSPEGINQFHSRNYPGMPAEFSIRDANYYPTFHESATKIDEFTREAGIGSLDLVLGINQKFLEDIIRLVEPVSLPGVAVPIDHYNAMLILSMLVEGKKTLTDTPKGSVKALGNSIFHTLQNEHKVNQALYILAHHIFQGEIIAGSPKPEIQKALDNIGIFERWRGKKGDWMYPLFTSISRNKSDRLMERTFEIEQVNSCERILTMSQKHWYDLTERNRIEDLAKKLGMEDKIPLLLPIQGAGDNVQYLRFILPPGTKYLPQSKSGFTLLENTPLYTTIHGYETTKPGTTSVLKIHYILPDGYCGDMTEFFKQPGLRNTRFLVKKGDKVIYQTFYE